MIAACGDADRTVEIPFRVQVGGEPLACGTTYTGLGTSRSTWEPLEAKLFVHAPRLVRADGTEVEIALEQDDRWQRDAFALLDFDDSQGRCAPADIATNTALRGTVPDGDYTGLRFEIGLPPESNHLDAATAPAPLNQPGMWWSWRGGYKFMRFDGVTRGNPAYYLHLGASGCEGSVAAGFACTAGNVPVVDLASFDVDADAVQLDLAQVWEGVDLDRQIDFQTDFVQGCMSSAADPECPTVLAALGLGLDGVPTGSPPAFVVGAP